MIFLIFIFNSGYIGTAVRIIFDAGHHCVHISLITLEIDNPVIPLLTAALMTDRYGTGIITARMLLQDDDKAFLRL